MLVMAMLPAWRTTLEDCATQSLEHRMMPMAESQKIAVVITAAFLAREDVMNIEHGGAFAAEEPAATTKTVAYEYALSDLDRHRHDRSHAYIAALIGRLTPDR